VLLCVLSYLVFVHQIGEGVEEETERDEHRSDLG
jgi:hypothetical protein